MKTKWLLMTKNYIAVGFYPTRRAVKNAFQNEQFKRLKRCIGDEENLESLTYIGLLCNRSCRDADAQDIADGFRRVMQSFECLQRSFKNLNLNRQQPPP